MKTYFDRDKIIKEMRADRIYPGESGRWKVWIQNFDQRHVDKAAFKVLKKEQPFIPIGLYTMLSCMTMETMMNGHGVIVMNDYPSELKKHLQFINVARGNVLVTGLGLGCVVRGLLAHGKVERITVIERSPDVIKICGDSVKDKKVEIRQQDALSGFVRGQWDFAWHDLWNDPDASEPHLQLIHAKLMTLMIGKVRHQGCWAFPRRFKRRIPDFIG